MDVGLNFSDPTLIVIYDGIIASEFLHLIDSHFSSPFARLLCILSETEKSWFERFIQRVPIKDFNYPYLKR